MNYDLRVGTLECQLSIIAVEPTVKMTVNTQVTEHVKLIDLHNVFS